MIYVRADFDCGREKGQTADKKLWRETMILAIDIGNTNIVVGCIDREKTYFIERLSTVRTKTELESHQKFLRKSEILKLSPRSTSRQSR